MMNPIVNHLYEGDCVEVMKSWPDGCIDHCITDPPYNMSKPRGLSWAFSSHVTMNEKWDIYSRQDYLSFCKQWLTEVCRVVRDNGNIFVFGSFHNIYDIGHLIHEMDLKIINSIVWFKPNAQPNITCRMLTESTEHIIWACNGNKSSAKKWVFNYKIAKQLNGDKQMRNMWSFPYPSKSERKYGKHPSQKPLDLLERIIRVATNENDIILDCFSGSGTTGVAAKRLQRKWVLIDNNPAYNAIARERLAAD